LQLVKQDGNNKAVARPSCGAGREFHLFRILTVAGARFSRAARTKAPLVAQLLRDISQAPASKNISL